MAATLEEYRDILIADTFVDLPRLKLRAQHGVPVEIRSVAVSHARLCLPFLCLPSAPIHSLHAQAGIQEGDMSNWEGNVGRKCGSICSTCRSQINRKRSIPLQLLRTLYLVPPPSPQTASFSRLRFVTSRFPSRKSWRTTIGK
jgi:hypothetical protein